jgi:multidrug transporter EmrE-like cation transporter
LSAFYLLRGYAQRAGRDGNAGLVGSDLPWLSGAIASGGIAGPVLLLIGLTLTPASSASLLLNLEGVLTAILAWFVFKENFDRRILMGMLLIVAAGVVLSWEQMPAMGIPWGALAIAGACLCWAIDNKLYPQSIGQRRGADSGHQRPGGWLSESDDRACLGTSFPHGADGSHCWRNRSVRGTSTVTMSITSTSIHLNGMAPSRMCIGTGTSHSNTNTGIIPTFTIGMSTDLLKGFPMLRLSGSNAMVAPTSEPVLTCPHCGPSKLAQPPPARRR